MASSIEANLASWSATEASNKPAGTDTADLDADLRRLQGALRKYLRSPATPIASGTTVDLATADGDYVSVTGDTQVEALGTVSSGMRFILVFSGTPVIKHNATSLNLPGGADITAAAGDVAWVESLGSGNWRCLAYQKADGTPVIKTTTTASISDIAYGTYTPTLTNVTNIASSTAYESFYIRIGDIVQVSGYVVIDPTADATTTNLRISLPVASDFTQTYDLSGVGYWNASGTVVPARLLADATNNDAYMSFLANSTSGGGGNYSFMYIIK